MKTIFEHIKEELITEINKTKNIEGLEWIISQCLNDLVGLKALEHKRFQHLKSLNTKL